MKSVIIIPHSTFLENDHVFPHLGPYYIKRYVEENSNHEVLIKHKHFHDINFEDIDVIGFSATTPQYNEAVKLAKNLPKTIIKVIGGPHARHYDLSKDKFWDYVIENDGCKPFLNILNKKNPGNDHDDKEQLPFRDETFHDYKYYLDGNPTTVIMTSRGCPNNCAFCEHANTPVRLKSPEVVRKEIQECIDLGFTGIMFFDDLFCLNMNRVKQLCKVIKPFGIKFRCFAHARNFTEKMASLLSDAGCLEIGYGAEHADQKILDIINKGTTVDQNYKIIEISHNYGIRVKAFLLLGLPGETNETAAKLEKFVLTSKVDDFDVSIYYPYKGTKIANSIQKFDLFLDNVESTIGYYKGKNGFAECATRTSELSAEEIKNWRKKIYSHNKRWKG